MSTWHLSTWSRSGDLRLGQSEARDRGLVTAPVCDLAECEVIFPTQSELSGLDC